MTGTNGLLKNIELGTNMSTSHGKTYTIQYLMKQPINRENWVTMTGFAYMQKSFAEGAFCMLRSFYGGEKRYRLIDSEGKVVAEWNTGTIQAN